jgi:hypothetical protein
MTKRRRQIRLELYLNSAESRALKVLMRRTGRSKASVVRQLIGTAYTNLPTMETK